jgi:pimeloyl-ACP methyl ester carboxylesterase
MGKSFMLRFALGLAAALAAAPLAWAQDKPPLVIAKQSYFYVGGHYDTTHDAHHMVGQMYVEYQIPQARTHPFPIVMVHGGSQTGLDWIGTPDGREGWEQFFLRRGYAVYVVDQVGRGRSNYEGDVYGKQSSETREYAHQRFAASEKYNTWPQAHLHTQWPGGADFEDPTMRNYMASSASSMADRRMQTTMNVEALSALLDKIGPSIVFVHSQSGQYGWPLAQARPALVKALVALEPSGPPVHDLVVQGAPRFGVAFDAATSHGDDERFRDSPSLKRYGPVDVPLAYDPPITDPAQLKFVRQDKAEAPDVARCWRQAEPARKLVAVGDRPIIYIAAEASFYAPYSHCTVGYLEQAGVHVDFVHLADLGIHGNGHMMMMEKNSDQVAEVAARWLEEKVGPLEKQAQAH